MLLGDPILFVESKGYILTDRARGLEQVLCNSLAAIQTALQPQAKFEPSRSERKFVVAMTDYAEVAFAPKIIAEFLKFAPNCKIGIRRLPNYNPSEELARSVLDLCITFRFDSEPGLKVRRLFTDRFVSMIRANHP